MDLNAFLTSKQLIRSGPIAQLQEWRRADATSPSMSSNRSDLDSPVAANSGALIPDGNSMGSPSQSQLRRSQPPQGSFSPTRERSPCRLAMDGNYFIASRITELNSIDASWFLHSPLPSGLLELVANEVKRLRTQAVEPVFVFNGLPVHGDVESFVNTPDELRLREEIWAELNVGSYVTREVIERAFDIVLGEDVEMALMRYMSQKLSVEVYRAPFLHWGEMVAMQQGKPYYADEVFGPVEMLAMDNITRVITHVDSRKASFNYINKDDVLQSLFPRVRDKKASASLFMDLVLITATHPSLSLLRPALPFDSTEKGFLWLCRVVEQKMKVTDAVNGSFTDANKGKHQTTRLLKGRTFLKHCMVMLPQSADLIPLSRVLDPKAKVPSNLINVLGSRLPAMMYFLQFIGLMPVSCMTTITQNFIQDDNPIADSAQYRSCMEILLSLRTQILYQMVQFLGVEPEYRHRLKVSWVRWYEPISVVVQRPPDIHLDSWRLSDVSSEIVSVNLRAVLNLAGLAISQPTHYCNAQEVHMAVLLKSLDLLGYFTHPSEQPSEPSGKSLFAQVLSSDGVQSKYVERLLVLIELLRTHSLSNTAFLHVNHLNSSSILETPVPPLSDEDAATVFASRVVCLVDFKTTTGQWRKNYERDLTAFGVLLRSMHRTLRCLVEVISASLFLEGSCQCDPEVFLGLPALLPFGTPPSIVGGLMCLFILGSPDDFSSEGADTPSARIHQLEMEFPVCTNLRQDIASMFAFWANAMCVIDRLAQESDPCIPETLLITARMANKLMLDKRDLYVAPTPEE